MAELNGAADPGGASPSSAPPPVSNGADHGAEKTFTVTDTRSAGDAIAGLLFADGDPPAPKPGDKPSGEPPQQEPPDPGADESRPTEEDDKGPGEQPPPPAAAIEPPTSWSQDAKQVFSQLPLALQQTVARRESQREAVVAQSTQEAAEARRAYDGERQAAVAQRAEYLAGLQRMLVLAAPEAEALQNLDWVAVARENPAEAVRLQAQKEQLKSRLAAIGQEFEQGKQQLELYQQQQLAGVVAKEQRALNEKMPDFGDAVKGNQLRKDLGAYLQDAGGFTPAEINTAYDHRLVVLATKAMLYDKQLAASASADAKRNNVAAPVRAPGTSQDNDRGPQSRLTRAVNRFGRSNSVRDAGSLIAEIL